MDVKPGDIVHVRVRVSFSTEYDYGPLHSGKTLALDGTTGQSLEFANNKIVKIEERPLQVGDIFKVTTPGPFDGFKYKIVAIRENGEAWVEYVGVPKTSNAQHIIGTTRIFTSLGGYKRVDSPE